MKKTLLLNLLILLNLIIVAQPAPPSNLFGVDLREWLKQNWYDSYHNSLGYSDARKQMYSYIDKKNDGNVYCVYTGFNQPGDYVSFLDPINCEHTVPQSWFSQGEPMRSDIHHLYPTHEDVNSARSNFPFDDITDNQTDAWYIVNSSNTGLMVLNNIPSSNIDAYSELKTSTKFEPREDHKGNAARAIFYFYTMYPNAAGYITNIADLSLLYEWHLNDPVDDWETQRNNRTEDRQGNRNPYIDYPNIVCKAWDIDCLELLQFTSVPVTVATTNTNYVYNIFFEGENAEITATEIPDWLYLTEETDSYAVLSGVPLAEHIGENSVVLSISNGEQTINQEFIINVSDNNILIDIDFTECPPANWTFYNKQDANNWYCENDYIAVNAYGGNETCNEWFISRELDLEEYSAKILSFNTWTAYSDSQHPRLKVKYSTNYTGNGNPENATWTNLNYNYPIAGSQTWTSSGEVSLSAIEINPVYIAFQYTSSGTEAGTSTFWKLDDILLTGNYSNTVDFANEKIKIFPNPSNKFLNIENINKNNKIFIVDILGKKIIETYNKQENNININIQKLQKGIYFIIFEKNGFISSRKFIKK